MSWIKITQYLPGNNRRIQIWNDNKLSGSFDNTKGAHYGFYEPVNKKWWSLSMGGQFELNDVTHWAEVLGEPDEFKKPVEQVNQY